MYKCTSMMYVWHNVLVGLFFILTISFLCKICGGIDKSFIQFCAVFKRHFRFDNIISSTFTPFFILYL